MNIDATVPAELRTERLLLRAWRAEDAHALLPVLQANFAYLSPWIPARIATPSPIPELGERLTAHAAEFMADKEWRYALLSPDASHIIGEVSLFPRNAAGRVPLMGWMAMVPSRSERNVGARAGFKHWRAATTAPAACLCCSRQRSARRWNTCRLTM